MKYTALALAMLSLQAHAVCPLDTSGTLPNSQQLRLPEIPNEHTFYCADCRAFHIFPRDAHNFAWDNVKFYGGWTEYAFTKYFETLKGSTATTTAIQRISNRYGQTINTVIITEFVLKWTPIGPFCPQPKLERESILSWHVYTQLRDGTSISDTKAVEGYILSVPYSSTNDWISDTLCLDNNGKRVVETDFP